MIVGSVCEAFCENLCNLYYYRSFSCFFAKIFSMAMNFRMTSFAPREAMTTAEPPEPLTVQHSDPIMNKQNLQEFVGPAARHSVCSVYSVDSKILIYRAFRAFRAFRGSN